MNYKQFLMNTVYIFWTAIKNMTKISIFMNHLKFVIEIFNQPTYSIISSMITIWKQIK